MPDIFDEITKPRDIFDEIEPARPRLPSRGQVLKGFLTPLPQVYKSYRAMEDWRAKKFTKPIREKIESVLPPKQIGKVVRSLISPIPSPIRKLMERKPEIRKIGEKIEDVLGRFTSEQLADAVTNPLILLPMIGKIAKTKAIQPMIRGVLRARRLKELRKIRKAGSLGRISSQQAELAKLQPSIQAGISKAPPQPQVMPLSRQADLRTKATKEIVSYQENVLKTDPTVKKITEALKGAKPIRGKQEALYSAVKAKQTARIVAMGKKVPGEKGYFAQLGQLKGEMPKVQFESIRKQVNQTDIDSLFNLVEQHNYLSPFEKVTTKTGLAKILGVEGGAVPTKGELNLLSEVFPQEFIQTVLSKRPLRTKFWEGVGNAINFPRAMMATADFSAPLRQGIFLVGRPNQWVPAFGNMFKYAFREKAYQGLMEGIKARPTYKLMRESKLALTEMGANLAKREELFMSNLAERIPIFGRIARGSNRAYTGFLNKLRADVFDDLVKSANKLGITEKSPDVIKDIARFVNNATGRGGVGNLGDAAIILNGTFFSPRLAMSRFNLLNPIFYIGLNPFVRKEALRSLFTFAGAGASVLGLAKAGGLEVGVNPLSADFGKIKVGDTRYDIWGGFQQYVVAAARLVANNMVSSTTGKVIQFGVGYKPINRLDIVKRFLASKASPIASFAMDLLRGRTAIGEKVRVIPNLADRFIPMVSQDFFELYRDEGIKGLGMALPAVFGTGVQTYGEQIPMKGKTPSGREKIEWRQKPTLGETIYNKATGTIISTIPKEEQRKLAKERMRDTLRKIEINKVKRVVLETGKSQTVDGVRVYMDRGIVKTKRIRTWR